MNGKIQKLYTGYGFITGEDKKDYFFHSSALEGVRFRDLQEGQEVEFEDTETEKGRRAEDVRLM